MLRTVKQHLDGTDEAFAAVRVGESPPSRVIDAARFNMQVIAGTVQGSAAFHQAAHDFGRALARYAERPNSIDFAFLYNTFLLYRDAAQKEKPNELSQVLGTDSEVDP